MPFWMGAMGSHDDSSHQGSAKRDTALGVAGLSAGGDLLVPGDALYITRSGGNQILTYERTSNELAAFLTRTAVNTYAGFIRESAADKRIQTDSMKDIASGIAGLDASILLALTQQRLNFKLGALTYNTATATGTVAITGVGFQPRVVMLMSIVNTTSEMSIGWDDLTAVLSLINSHNVTATTWQRSPTNSIVLYQSAGIYVEGYISVMGADGFTIAFTKTGLKTGTANIFYLALR